MHQKVKTSVHTDYREFARVQVKKSVAKYDDINGSSDIKCLWNKLLSTGENV